jgi:hypothetical protein
MMLVRSFILGLDIDFVAPSSHPLTKNETKYDFCSHGAATGRKFIDRIEKY